MATPARSPPPPPPLVATPRAGAGAGAGAGSDESPPAGAGASSGRRPSASASVASAGGSPSLAHPLELLLGPRPLVLLLDSGDAAVEAEALRRAVAGGGCDVRALALRSAGAAAAHPLLPLADAVLVWHTLRVDAALVARLPRARALVRVGVGYDNVDLAACGAAGLPVVNVPAYGTEEVADHAMGLLLDLFRRTPWAAASARAGVAATGSDGCAAAAGARRLRGCVLGLLGCGRIGTAVALRAKAFGLDVVFFDPAAPAGREKALGVRRADSVLALARQADALSCHCDLNATSRHIVDAKLLRAMPRGAYVINTARGGVVDEVALAAALRDGHLGGAGIDVHELEPYVEDAATQPLAGAPNVICTPHTAFYSAEAFVELRTSAAVSAGHALNGVPLTNVVNLRHLPATREAGLRADIARPHQA